MNAKSIGVLVLAIAGMASLALADGLVASENHVVAPSSSSSPASVEDLSTFSLGTPISPDFEDLKPVYRNFRDLQNAISEEKQRRHEALFTWNLPDGREVEVVAKPTIQTLNVPWSPMIAMEDLPFTPENATRKIEVEMPVLKLLW